MKHTPKSRSEASETACDQDRIDDARQLIGALPPIEELRRRNIPEPEIVVGRAIHSHLSGAIEGRDPWMFWCSPKPEQEGDRLSLLWNRLGAIDPAHPNALEIMVRLYAKDWRCIKGRTAVGLGLLDRLGNHDLFKFADLFMIIQGSKPFQSLKPGPQMVVLQMLHHHNRGMIKAGKGKILDKEQTNGFLPFSDSLGTKMSAVRSLETVAKSKRQAEAAGFIVNQLHGGMKSNKPASSEYLQTYIWADWDPVRKRYTTTATFDFLCIPPSVLAARTAPSLAKRKRVPKSLSDASRVARPVCQATAPPDHSGSQNFLHRRSVSLPMSEKPTTRGRPPMSEKPTHFSSLNSAPPNGFADELSGKTDKSRATDDRSLTAGSMPADWQTLDDTEPETASGLPSYSSEVQGARRGEDEADASAGAAPAEYEDGVGAEAGTSSPKSGPERATTHGWSPDAPLRETDIAVLQQELGRILSKITPAIRAEDGDIERLERGTEALVEFFDANGLDAAKHGFTLASLAWWPKKESDRRRSGATGAIAALGARKVASVTEAGLHIISRDDPVPLTGRCVAGGRAPGLLIWDALKEVLAAPREPVRPPAKQARSPVPVGEAMVP